MSRVWPALQIEARSLTEPPEAEERLALLLDDCAPQAIEDLAERPLPAEGVWDPTFPAIPEPPPTPLRWRVFFSTPRAREEAVREIEAQLPGLRVTPIDVEDDDWATRSQASLTAVRAGRFVVAPPWEVPRTADPESTVVIIEPSMGFGTGHHPTTRLCLRLLSEVELRGRRVLDIGTGSGVLAMAAALSGAAEVVAIDVDADAIDSARTSAALNPLPPVIRFEVADFREQTPVSTDVVMANLTGGMLRRTASTLASRVNPRGTLLVSGFDVSEETEVVAAFSPLRATVRLEEEGWVAVTLQVPPRHAP